MLTRFFFLSFNAYIRFTYGPEQGCGGSLNLRNGASQQFRSLDTNNDGFYEPSLNCQWLVIAQNGKNVKLTFSSFDVERAVNETDVTCWDYVEVGNNSIGPSIKCEMTTASNKFVDFDV